MYKRWSWGCGWSAKSSLWKKTVMQLCTGREKERILSHNIRRVVELRSISPTGFLLFYPSNKTRTSSLATSCLCLSLLWTGRQKVISSLGRAWYWTEVSQTWKRNALLCHSPKSHYSSVHATHSSLGRSGIHYLPSALTFWLQQNAESLKISSPSQTMTRNHSWPERLTGCVHDSRCPPHRPRLHSPSSSAPAPAVLGQAGWGELGQERATSCLLHLPGLHPSSFAALETSIAAGDPPASSLSLAWVSGFGQPEKGSKQTFWGAHVRRSVRGGGRKSVSAVGPSLNVRGWFESQSLKQSDVSSVAVGSIELNW